MLTIWKFELDVTDEQYIEMPNYSKVLSVQVQYDKPCIWVLVNTSEPKTFKLIRLFGTGQPINETLIKDMSFVGTFQLDGGEFVGHVFVL
jgi:hypothetical protein